MPLDFVKSCRLYSDFVSYPVACFYSPSAFVASYVPHLALQLSVCGKNPIIRLFIAFAGILLYDYKSCSDIIFRFIFVKIAIFFYVNFHLFWAELAQLFGKPSLFFLVFPPKNLIIYF